MFILSRNKLFLISSIILIFLSLASHAQEVGSGGNLAMSYPIMIPPGTGGIQPSLSLVYNSSLHDGIAGIGWSLSGISQISRDLSYPVNFDGYDHYLYNGQKLIPESLTSNIYHTERESYLLFEAYDAANNTAAPGTEVAYWIMKNKNGMTTYFGYDPDDPQDREKDGYISAMNGQEKALIWSLRKVKDIWGNYYIVDYLKTIIPPAASIDFGMRSYYPEKIMYTKNDLYPLPKLRMIEFIYGSRGDHDVKYVPTAMDLDLRLTWIRVKMGEEGSMNLYSKYKLTYNSSSNTSRLESITEYGRDGVTTLPATIFQYPEDTDPMIPGYKYGGLYSTDWEDYTFLQADITGNGMSDFVMVKNKDTDNNVNLNVITYRSDGDGTFSQMETMDFQLDTSIPPGGTISDIIDFWNYYSAFTADVNGDGKSDLIMVRNLKPETYTLKIITFLSTGNGRFDSGTLSTYSLDNWKDYNAYTGDVDADARADILLVRDNLADDSELILKTFGSLGTGEFGAEKTDNTGMTGAWKDEYITLKPDINGDGCTDIVMIEENGTALAWKADGSGKYNSPVNTTLSIDGSIDDYSIHTPDMNNDGCMDLVFVNDRKESTESYLLTIYTYVSNRKGNYILKKKDINAEGAWSLYTSHVLHIDGDTYPDIAMVKGSGHGYGYPDYDDYFKIRPFLYKTRGEFVGGEYQSYDKPDWTNSSGFTGDTDGNGKGDIMLLWVNSTDELRYTTFLTHSCFTNLITNIQNSNGGTVYVGYVPICQAPGAVDPGISSYPVIADKSAKKLVCQIVIDDKINTYLSTLYSYTNSRITIGKPDQRMWLGFRTIKALNVNTTNYTIIYYMPGDDYDLRGMVEKSELFGVTDSGTQLFSRFKYTYTKNTGAQVSGYHPVTTIYTTAEILNQYNGGADYVTHKTAYLIYDDYGNPTAIRNYGNTSTTDDDVRILIDYIYSPYHYQIVPKQVRTQTLNSASEWELAGKERFFYDYLAYGSIGEYGRISKKQNYENDTSYITTEYSYDVDDGTHAYGNLTGIKDPNMSGGDDFSRRFTYDYDYKTFLKTETNALGMVNTIIYNNLKWPTRIVDYNGIPQYIKYDTFGRITKKYMAPETEEQPTFEYEYVDADGILGVLITPGHTIAKSKDSSPDGYHYTYTYYDGIGRIIQAKAEAEDGQYRTVSYYYNASGQNHITSVPYYTDTHEYTNSDIYMQKGTQKIYDPLGRITEEIHTDGSSTTYQYKSILTSTGERILRTIIKDPLDHLSKQDVYGGNRMVNKTFTRDGATGEYELYTKTETRSTRDVTEIIDINGAVISTQRNMLGRKLTYTDPDMGTWSYTYDANGNLDTQTDAKNQAISFDYDNLNRVRHKYYNGQLHTTFLYDGKDDTGQPEEGEDYGTCTGRLTKVEYPDGLEKYTYDDRGRIVTVKKTIWGAGERTITMSYDSRDRLVEETYPDGEVVRYAYGNDGNLISVTGTRDGEETSYSRDIEYTAYNKLKSILAGNGIATGYYYYDNDETADPSNENRTHSYRLKEIIVGGASCIVSHTLYEYDACDNIKVKEFNDYFGKSYTDTYNYDDLNRLTQAFSPAIYGDKYYTYQPDNNIAIKDGKSYVYEYDNSNGEYLAHAVSEIRDNQGNPLFTYTYDQNGNMTGAVGMSKIIIRARGTGVEHEPPEMELWLAGEKQMSWSVTDTEYKEYTWHGYWDGVSTIDIVFANDNQAGGEDTNLIVDWMELNGVKKQSEGTNVVYDKGYYPDGCFDGVNTVPGQQWMGVTGALRFAVVGILTIERSLTYDMENRITSIDDNGTVTTFTYNTWGKRIKKTANGSTTYYFFGHYEEVVDAETKKISYYFVNGQRVAQRTTTGSDSELLYIHTDHLGSAVQLTDEDQNVVQSIAYGPFGKTVYSAGTKDPAHQFTDQEFDSGTGLYYYGARYYDPELGRFIQPDTVLDGLNRYSYCYNNPVKYVDPTGHFGDYHDAGSPPGSYDPPGVIGYAPGSGFIYAGNGNNTGAAGEDGEWDGNFDFLPADPYPGQEVEGPYKYGKTKYVYHADGYWTVYVPVFDGGINAYPHPLPGVEGKAGEGSIVENPEQQGGEGGSPGEDGDGPGGGDGDDTGGDLPSGGDIPGDDGPFNVVVNCIKEYGTVKNCVWVAREVANLLGLSGDTLYQDINILFLYLRGQHHRGTEPGIQYLGRGGPGGEEAPSETAQDYANQYRLVLGISEHHIAIILPDHDKKALRRGEGPRCGGGGMKNAPNYLIDDTSSHFNWRDSENAYTDYYYFSRR